MQILRHFMIPLRSFCSSALRREKARIRGRVSALLNLHRWFHPGTWLPIIALHADSLSPRFEALLPRSLTLSTGRSIPNLSIQLHRPAATPAASFKSGYRKRLGFTPPPSSTLSSQALPINPNDKGGFNSQNRFRKVSECPMTQPESRHALPGTLLSGDIAAFTTKLRRTAWGTGADCHNTLEGVS
jgi:hypothetical protein